MTLFLRPCAAFLLCLLLAETGHAGREPAGSFRLSQSCPEAFLKSQDGLCRLKATFYPQGGSGAAWKMLPKTKELAEGLDPKSIDLGRLLFFDPLLSGDHSQSCADCHQPDRGFSDGRSVSLGSAGLPLTRSAPSLWNVGLLSLFFWDGRAKTLEQQAEGPLFSPHEMANTPLGLTKSLKANKTYASLFAEVFPDAKDVVKVRHVTKALADFERTLISLNSPYDLYIRGDTAALSPAEIDGFNVFRSFVSRCTECHTPPLFTNEQFAVIGVPDKNGHAKDFGVGALLGEESLQGAFKVPTLRNIAKTAPYMHAGHFATLDEVVTFYNSGGGRALSGSSPHIHWHIRPMGLTPLELTSLVLFLKTLNDESLRPATPQVVPSGLPVNVRQKNLADGKKGARL